ncbi:hypothetical protein N2152v2_006956 [Parachlorella kessleri]
MTAHLGELPRAACVVPQACAAGDASCFCAGKGQDGIFADPKDCSGYFQCTAGSGSALKCSSGLLFSSKCKCCTWAADVKCHAGKQGASKPHSQAHQAIPATQPADSAAPSQDAVSGDNTWQTSPRAASFPAQAKRGVVWHFRGSLGVNPLVPFDRISWVSNWGLEPETSSAAAYFAEQGIEFVPMLWGKWGVDDKLQGSIPTAAKYLLTFNEPNHLGQSEVWPKEAAALWPAIQAAAQARGLKLGSPAVSPCGGNDYIASRYADPYKWMEDFLDSCPGCTFDFINTHYYGCDIAWIKGYLKKWYKKYQLPVWLTEFACPYGDAATADQFLREFIEWADTQPWLVRYAWFSLDVGSYVWLGEGNDLMNLPQMTLTNLGQTYNTYAASGGVSSLSMPPPANGTSSSAQEVDWSELCSPCIGLAADAPADEQLYCQKSCGFWTLPETVPT